MTDSRSRWTDLAARSLSAVVLAPLFLFCLWMGGYIWSLVVYLLGFQMFREWQAMARPRWRSWSWPVGIIYLFFPCVALFVLRRDPVFGFDNVLFLILVVWATDIGAYLCGRVIGGPKLAPAISPGKTWSGALGGLVCAALVGLTAARLSAAPVPTAMLVAGGLGLASELGDLLESGFKRYFGVKDSGSLIPGHGGLLDRLDGLLAAAFAALLLVFSTGYGVELWR